MKKLLLLFAIIGLSSIATNLKASYFAGGYFSYENMGGISYKITFTLYRECDGINPQNNIYVSFNCTSNPNYNYSTSFSRVPGTGNVIPQICSTYVDSTNCNSSFLFGIEEYVYESVVQLIPCDEWVMSYSSCCRNPVTNVPNNNTNSWYVEARLNNLAAQSNSSPSFSINPQTFLCQNDYNSINLGVNDIDGDSLVFSFYPLMTNSPSTSINYAGIFSYNNFLVSSTPITIDSNTGEISLAPTMLGSTVFGVKVEEWRIINGIPKKLGTIYRDMFIKTVNCNGNTPKLSGMDTNLTHTYNYFDTIYYKDVCLGETISFDINGYDADTLNPLLQSNPESFEISWDNGIPQGSFNIFHNGTDSAYANFTWTPDSSIMINKEFYFTATITDFACPYRLSNTFTYRILVGYAAVNIGTDKILCQGDSVNITANALAGTTNFKWFLNGVFTGKPLSESNFLFDSDTLAAFNHLLSVIADDGISTCKAYDTININVVPKSQLNIADTVLNTPNGLILDAGLANSYEWYFGQSLVNTQRFYSPNQTGDYSVYINTNINGPCKDSAHFYFDLSASIQVNEDGKFNIYPNPIKDKVFIEFVENLNQQTNFEIYDLTGKLVLKEALNSGESKFSIDVNELNTGVYTYQIQSEEIYRGKIVIVK